MAPDHVLSIIHLVDAAAGHVWGKERVVLSLMEAQRSSRLINPILVTFSPSRMSTLARDNGFTTLSLDSYHRRCSVSAIKNLQALLKDWAPPVLHTHGYKPNIVGRFVRLMGGPSALVSTCHGWVEDSLPLKCYNAFDRNTSFLSDRIVLPDTNMMERLPTFSRASVIPNAIPSRPVPSAQERKEAKRKFGWGEDQFVVGMLTRITNAKGISEFEQAISLSRNANISWAVAGTEPHGTLPKTSPSRAQFIGYLTQPSEYLAALDVFVQASHSEGLSLALLEAARSALPIVATKVGATEHTLRDGKEALLIPAKDPKLLADSISMLYQDPELARRLGESARTRFEECYNIERMSEAYLRLYRNVLGKN